MGNRFPKTRRLHRSNEIDRVFDQGDFFKGTYMHMIRGKKDERPTRAAFIVSRKTALKAVERNRIKRLMRESFRLHLDEVSEGWPLIFLATRRSHGDLKRPDFDRELVALLEEADLLETTD